jgi:hypothetical protein
VKPTQLGPINSTSLSLSLSLYIYIYIYLYIYIVVSSGSKFNTIHNLKFIFVEKMEVRPSFLKTCFIFLIWILNKHV